MLIVFGTIDDELTLDIREEMENRGFNYKFLNLTEGWVSDYFESLYLQSKISQMAIPLIYNDIKIESFEINQFMSKTRLYEINWDSFKQGLKIFLDQYESM